MSGLQCKWICSFQTDISHHASRIIEGPQGKPYDDEDATQHGVIGEDDDSSADTVLEVFHETFLPTTTNTSKTEHTHCLLKLRRSVLNQLFLNELTDCVSCHRKPNSEFLFKALYSVLSSDRPNDDISGEVADIIGFEDIDLAMEILDHRVPILQEVRFLYIVWNCQEADHA